MKHDDYLLDSLINLQRITRHTHRRFSVNAAASGVGTVDLLLLADKITKIDIVHAKADHFGVQAEDLRKITYDAELLSTMKPETAWYHRAVPIRRYVHGLIIAISDPTDLNSIDTLRHVVGTEIEWHVADPDEILRILYLHYSEGEARGEMMRTEREALART